MRGTTEALEETLGTGEATAEEGPAMSRALEECDLLTAVGADLDMDSFLAGESTPLFVGSALTNFGVRHVLDAMVDLAPAPSPRSVRVISADPKTSFGVQVQLINEYYLKLYSF